MATKTKVSPTIVAKAREVLEFAQRRAERAANWIEVSNAVFGPEGKATEMFPTEAERAAFLRTAEYKRYLALINTLPHPPVNGIVDVTGMQRATQA